MDNVEQWFESLSPDQQKPLRQLRRLILSTDTEIKEEIKWGRPCYSKNSLFCYLQKASGHVVIGFQQGSLLSDPEKLLQGDGKKMRHIKVGSSTISDKSAIGKLIANAIEIDKKGG